MSEKLLYTVAEASAVLSISKPKLYELIAQGKIPVVRILDRGIRVPVAALQSVIDQATTVGGEAQVSS